MCAYDSYVAIHHCQQFRERTNRIVSRPKGVKGHCTLFINFLIEIALVNTLPPMFYVMYGRLAEPVMFSCRPPGGYIVNINIVIILANITHILICGTVYDNVVDYISVSSWMLIMHGLTPISYTLYFRLYQYFVLPIVLESVPARKLHAVNITEPLSICTVDINVSLRHSQRQKTKSAAQKSQMNCAGFKTDRILSSMIIKQRTHKLYQNCNMSCTILGEVGIHKK